MSLFVESNITFDFTAARAVIEHDKSVPTHSGGDTHGNNKWPGVDFCIEEASGSWIWLEVKSWDPAHIPPIRRGGNRRSFLCKMRSNAFLLEMRGKFLGTTAFLAWTGTLPACTTHFVLLFEPPHVLDAALLGSRMARLREQIQDRRWLPPVTVSVLTLSEWTARFGRDYPAH